MNTNQLLIQKFYTCFQNKDYKGMQDCYADNAVFNDSVFKNLNSSQVKAMWEMLIKSGKDLRVEFKDINATETNGTAHWDAYYTFSRTGNKVINRINATFTFENGKIVTHTDHFDFYSWAKQSLGLTGLLLGWTKFMKNKVQQTAMQNLNVFMKITK
ncbi:MAG: nuclear transport factor 2 family protein [Bacteroidota bacterium]